MPTSGMPKTRIAAAVATMLVAAGVVAPGSAVTGRTHRISVSTAGTQANGDTPATSVPDVTSPAMSLDGRWVAFSSDASNLVPGDRNGVADVFLRDMRRNKTRIISVARDGTQGNGPSYSPAMSVDGRWIAFVSSASNFVPDDDNGVADVFLVDRKTGRVELISVGKRGARANGPSNRPFVSLFGEWVTFESAASNLTGRADDNGMPDAFVRDRTRRRTRMIAAPPVPGEDGSELITWTENPTISYTGRFVSYVRKARRIRHDLPIPAADPPTVSEDVPVTGTHLEVAPPEDLLASDVFLRTMRRKRDRWIAVTKWAGRYTNFAENPQISADGNRVVFDVGSVLDADALAHSNGDVPPELRFPSDPLGPNPVDHRDVFMYDRVARVVFPVSKNMWGPQANGPSYAPQVTSQGHAVAFISEATNLVPGDTNGQPDVFVWDSRDRSVTLASARPDGTGANAATLAFSMSYEGRNIVFATAATNLATDTNNANDVYHHDRKIHISNTPPLMKRRVKGHGTVVVGEQVRFSLAAKDLDDDPLRYGVVGLAPPSQKDNPAAHPAGDMPAGMTVDTLTGEVTWAPQANQVGPWGVAFWVGDPRGTSAISIWEVVVRLPSDALICEIRGDC